MHQARIVDGFEAGEKLGGNLTGLIEVERAPVSENLLQRCAVDVLHRHQFLTVELLKVEDPADVRRDHLASRAHFLAKSFECVGVLNQLRAQGFQRHVLTQLQIVGPPNLTHPAPTQQGPNPVTLAMNLAFFEGVAGVLEGGRFFRVFEDFGLERGIVERQLQEAPRAQANAVAFPR